MSFCQQSDKTVDIEKNGSQFSSFSNPVFVSVISQFKWVFRLILFVFILTVIKETCLPINTEITSSIMLFTQMSGQTAWFLGLAT